MTGQCFSPGTPVSSTNKTDRHDITEIVLKVDLNTITLNPLFAIICYDFKFGMRCRCDVACLHGPSMCAYKESLKILMG